MFMTICFWQLVCRFMCFSSRILSTILIPTFHLPSPSKPNLSLRYYLSRSLLIPKEFACVSVAEALAKQINDDHLAKNQLYPSFDEIRKISAHIGAAVAAKAYELGKIMISLPLLNYN